MQHHISSTSFQSYYSDDLEENHYDPRKNRGLEVDDGFPSRSGFTDSNFPNSAEIARLWSSRADNDVPKSANLFVNEKRGQNSNSGDKEYSLLDYPFWNELNSDSTADYSFFSTTSLYDTSHKKNERSLGSLFIDTSDNSHQFANVSNSLGYNPDYVREPILQTCHSNLLDSKKTQLVSQSAHPLDDQQMELVRSIERMSKEEVERMINIIRIAQTELQSPPPINLYSTPPPPIVNIKNTHYPPLLSDENDHNLLKVVDQNRPSNEDDHNLLKMFVENRPPTDAASGKKPNVMMAWHGELPKCRNRSPLSRKVFVGGLPYHITEAEIAFVFNKYGNAILVWPGKENGESLKGYVYVIFEKEKQVKHLLRSCRDLNGDLYFNFPVQNGTKSKEVQIIPWSPWDNIFPVATNPQTNLNTSWMVYVGALHGTLNASGLFRIMDNLFGGVTYAGINVDKVKYPTGSGQVIFNNHDSYAKAITVGFVQVVSSKVSKTIQIEPFLKDSPCSICRVQIGPYFCREQNCFRYFCDGCWKVYHKTFNMSHDIPLTKNSKLDPPPLMNNDK